MRQEVFNTFPGIASDHVHILSCRNAQAHGSSKADPGGLQSFLKGLTSVFTTLTTAQMGNGQGALIPGQEQAYWTASLAVTHRQSGYLVQCLAHLQEFFAQVGPGSGSHHIDSHEDLGGGIGGELDVVTAAEHLRYAASCLAKITGRGEGGDVEDMLGVVFEK